MSAMPAIVVRNLSKKFRLFASPKQRVLEALHPFRKQYHHEFWALRDMSLEIQRGEILGILGRNGSGKSTLLQIICSVMQATHGEVCLNGRIAALLELGAGFNPEFTGRENVMLNGVIMGLSRKDMQRKLPEIEAFADVGEFFDQPVKTYSSGMFVRVAFAAAIHVNPDILVVDEALAVGDVRFQRKCLLQIEKIRANGATILFVSHSLDTITSLCSRAIILDHGVLIGDGEPKLMTEQYLSLLFSEPGGDSESGISLSVGEKKPDDLASAREQSEGDLFFASSSGHVERSLDGRFGYNRHEVRTSNGEAAIIDYLVHVNGCYETSSVHSGATVSVFVKVHFMEAVSQPIIGFELKTGKGVTIAGSNTFLAKAMLQPAAKNETRIYRVEFNVPLNEGDYFIDLGVAKYDGTPGGYVLDVRRSIIHLMINRTEQRRFNGILDLGFRFAEVDF